jgi:hypothetical protein
MKKFHIYFDLYFNILFHYFKIFVLFQYVTYLRPLFKYIKINNHIELYILYFI